MKKFSEFVSERTRGEEYIKELENLMYKCNIRNALQKAKKIKNEARYHRERENLNIWADQNCHDLGSYSLGSRTDVFRNYSYYSSMMSKKMRNHIESHLDFKDVEIKFEKEYKIDDENTFYIKYKPRLNLFHGFPEKLIRNSYNIMRLNTDNVRHYFEYMFEMSINKTGAFSFNTYRNRKKVSPDKVIPKNKLLDEVKELFKEAYKEMTSDVEWRNLVTLVLVDEVIGNYYIKDTKEIVREMKDALQHATSVEKYKEILRRYGFKNIPGDDIIEGLLDSGDFEYDRQGSKKYGHFTGTMYRINFEQRIITSEGYSSDD